MKNILKAVLVLASLQLAGCVFNDRPANEVIDATALDSSFDAQRDALGERDPDQLKVDTFLLDSMLKSVKQQHDTDEFEEIFDTTNLPK